MSGFRKSGHKYAYTNVTRPVKTQHDGASKNFQYTILKKFNTKMLFIKHLTPLGNSAGQHLYVVMYVVLKV